MKQLKTGIPSLTDHRKAERTLSELEALEASGHYPYQANQSARNGAVAIIDRKPYLAFSSYDYLGLVGHSKINEASIEAIHSFGTGTGGVRLLTGTNQLHHELETAIASFLGTEASASFTSGYVANLAIATTVIGDQGMVFADERIHRSFVDALNLAKANVAFFPHNDTKALRKMLSESESSRKFIVSEGVFSMDGDLCPLPELVELKEEFSAFLIMDEAHSFGVLGNSGRGIHEHFGLTSDCVDIYTGSLSKAIPANGGFAACSRELVRLLQHASAPFIFSGSLCPPACAASLAALDVIQHEPDRLQTLSKVSEKLRGIVRKNGFSTTDSPSPVIPIQTGDYDLTFELSAYLKDHGIWTTPVVFPAVSARNSLIRLCASVHHNDSMLATFDQALAQFHS